MSDPFEGCCPGAEAGTTAAIYAHYLDWRGREQRMAIGMTQDACRVVETTGVLRTYIESFISAVGGQLLAVQLELSDERVIACEPTAEAQRAKEAVVVQMRPRRAETIVRSVLALLCIALGVDIELIYG